MRIGAFSAHQGVINTKENKQMIAKTTETVKAEKWCACGHSQTRHAGAGWDECYAHDSYKSKDCYCTKFKEDKPA